MAFKKRLLAESAIFFVSVVVRIELHNNISRRMKFWTTCVCTCTHSHVCEFTREPNCECSFAFVRIRPIVLWWWWVFIVVVVVIHDACAAAVCFGQGHYRPSAAVSRVTISIMYIHLFIYMGCYMLMSTRTLFTYTYIHTNANAAYYLRHSVEQQTCNATINCKYDSDLPRANKAGRLGRQSLVAAKFWESVFT